MNGSIFKNNERQSQAPSVKVCGMTRLEDALYACELGADAVGFIFYEKSPRYILPVKAARIAQQLPESVSRVGVFANPSIADLEVAIDKAGLHAIQLHGQHDLNLISHFRKKTKVICAFNISRDFDFTELAAWRDHIDAFLLDGYKKDSYGGTGAVVDWQRAGEAKRYGPIILAGGLSPENIVQAISRVKPLAVDVNSGVEDRPGIKNHTRLEQFFNALSALRF